MLTNENFTKENIYRLRNISGNDPSLLEKAIYAFGLLEAITKVGMPFIFKGGSCLMLLLEEPKRLSTDIDIIVEPGTNIEEYITDAGKLFPFINQNEDVRKGKNKIEKRHYEFTYESPVNNKPLVILLDILFEKSQYPTLIEKPIQNSMLLTEGENLTVKIPDINCILGDKLTAFAPNTTGVPFNEGKDLEIIKQLFDCYTLQKEMTDFSVVKEVFNKVAAIELGYRGLDYNTDMILKDTMSSCFSIISKGKIKEESYKAFINGIRLINNHIYKNKFNGDVAAYISCEVLYLAACIYKDVVYKQISDYNNYLDVKLSFKGARSINYIKKVRPDSYAYLAAASELLGDEIENIIYFTPPK